MMSRIIGGAILFAVIAGAFGRTMGEVSTAAMTACGDAIALVVSLAGTLCFWSGVMEIARRSGLANALSRAFLPLTRRLFPAVPPDSTAMGAITMNMTANLLGLGNAATPLGLTAMRELERGNPDPWRASHAMIIFVVLNTASLQLLPTTNAYLRLRAGSTAPMEILPAVWLASAASVAAALLASALLGRREKKRVRRL